MEKCYCEKLKKAVANNEQRNTYHTTEVWLGSTGHDTQLFLQYDYDTKNYEFCGSGEDNATTPIYYCPFCGKKLKKKK